MICRKAIFMLPDADFLSSWCQSPSSRAQNRGFCALLAFGTPIFGRFEHKIGVFVRFCQQVSSRWHPPASNKPHPAEKSTPVWLAIWRTWAGFANSQLLPDAAALSSMQGLPRSGNSSAQTSASLHPPAALRLRVLPFTRTWSSTVCAEEFPTLLEMSLHGLHLLRQTQIFRPICTDCLRHLRISAE